MNRIVLVGRLETTPELRHTSTGIPVANFSLSVRRSIPNGQGRYERDIFRVVTWRKLAETCCRFLERGRMIAVDGKLQNRLLQNPNGDKRVIVEIHADDVRFLEGAKPRGDSAEAGNEEKSSTPETESDKTETREPVAVAVENADQADETDQTDESDQGSTEESGTALNEPVSSPDSFDEDSKENLFDDESDGTPL